MKAAPLFDVLNTDYSPGNAGLSDEAYRSFR
jgi:hypothetical protein